MGTVTMDELGQKEFPGDPSAEAAILFKIGEVSIKRSNDGFTTFIKTKIRLKIYTIDGLHWANQEILHATANTDVKINHAVTYNLENGQITKTNLKKDGDFDENVTTGVSRRKLLMPNVKPGSVIEYDCEVTERGIDSPRDWQFQTSIPVVYSEFKTCIPDYFIFNTNQRGFVFPTVKSEKTFSSGDAEKTTTYIARNLPAIREEAYVNNMANYTSTLSHEIAMINFPDGSTKKFATDWEAVTKTIYEYEDFGPELKKTGYFEKAVDSVTKGLQKREDIVKAVYNYVRTTMKWNNHRGYYCKDGVRRAFKSKEGNAAEINLMLVSMLRYKQVNANPVLLSTRDNGITFFPGIEAFNYVIAAVEGQKEDDFELLDATEKLASPGVLPLRDLNWFGRLIRKDGSSTQLDMIPKLVSKESDFMAVKVNADGVLDGKVRRQFSDYEALCFRDSKKDTKEDTYIEELENASKIEIADYIKENGSDGTLPLSEKFSFKDSKGIEVINDKIYISPMSFMALKDNPFKIEKREFPVDFGYPLQKKINIQMEIPEGYAIESMPTGVSMVTEDNACAFRYAIADNGASIQIMVASDIKSPLIVPQYYPALKEFYQQIIAKQNEKIVLVKKM